MRLPGVRRLRVRLTLTHLVLLAAVVLVFVAGTSLVMEQQLRIQLRRQVLQDLATLEGLVAFDGYGHPYLRAELGAPADSRYVLDRYLDIVAPDGQVLYRADRLGVGLQADVPPGDVESSVREIDWWLEDGTPVLMATRTRLFENGVPATLRLGYPLTPIRQRVHDWVVDTLLSLGVMLAIAGLAAWELARRALRPIDEMAARVARMPAGRLDERLPVDGVDAELADLARVFNGLLDRVARAVDGLKRFTAEASHELRTPLAAIRTVGEVGLQRARTPEEYREVVGSMLEDVNRITRLADTLLDMARVDAGGETLHLERLPVRRLVDGALDVVGVLAEEKQQHVAVDVPEALTVTVDPIRIHQALVNVLHNAVKFSPRGGAVRVTAGAVDGGVRVVVTDSGPGVSAELGARAFERFVSVGEEAADRPLRGAGLGLWIARTLVEAHGGAITLEPDAGGGAAVRIDLPA